MAPVLYKIDGSPPARTVMMVADILGINVNMKNINPVLREQDTPVLTKKNPMRTVPLLEEDDFCLADSHAIIIYLMDKYGKPEHESLYPSDRRKRATIHQRLFFDCGVLFPRLRSIMAPTYAGRLTEISQSMKKNVENAYKITEAYLSDTKYLADDVITIADISVMTTMSTLNGLHPIDGNRYPKLKQWYINMTQQEYSKRINGPGSKEHVDGLKFLMEQNKRNKKSKL